ncbi:golgin subfamily A member 2-like [Leptidea sinapis]|uniref:golgin subfamily A member 2-like n=1 Tax=Leptidea sinapis TaxID=189913 RepID=UPI002132DB94|nr:golgin subfamily A member 2-like [Leptidea sinapis]XP_050675766.1 golgin subfamily A member 2-like [Leptidea sinapis]XP_050675767.1 golgin subfamily A member 2-like [Leptidea sinapis]
MDARAAKLANARKKLRDHQEKKINQNDDSGQNSERDTEQNFGETKSSLLNNTCDNSLVIPSDITIQTKDVPDAIENSVINDTAIKQGVSCVQDIQTEYLLNNQKSLESKLENLQTQFSELNECYVAETQKHNQAKNKIYNLEREVENITLQYNICAKELLKKDELIKGLQSNIETLIDDNNSLVEQIEFTKSLLKTKETEYANLHSQACSYYNQLETTKLQIQQLTSDTNANVKNLDFMNEKEYLSNNINTLEQKIRALQQEKDTLTSHYEHYVKDLNDQLKNSMLRNEDLSKELYRLNERENYLVEQIGDMEIRLQNFNKKDFEVETQSDTTELQKQIAILEEIVEEVKKKYSQLEDQHQVCLLKIQELESKEKPECDHDNISIEKLSADITSDKIAAQRATEQNLQLKSDIEELQQVVVKMTKDKLELTEMLAHEKILNKELILKLADIEEKAKEVHKKLQAKDVEMIRLQNEWRQMERKNYLLQHDHVDMTSHTEEKQSQNDLVNKHDGVKEEDNLIETNNNDKENEILLNHHNNIDKREASIEQKTNCCIPKVDAMSKLQERFTHIMDEVANLSDEKHRLEHIILQLQNETDTICEYVALYQQQRSLLRKRDEERTHQLKIFEIECNELKRHLDELHQLFLRLAENNEFIEYLNKVAKSDEMLRINELLETLQQSRLVTNNLKNLGLESFYPCSCCSGKLIEV